MRIAVTELVKTFCIAVNPKWRPTNGIRGTRSRGSRGRWDYDYHWTQNCDWAPSGPSRMEFEKREDAEEFLDRNRSALESALP